MSKFERLLEASARIMAANSLLDRGWGKAAQLVAVDGEVRQLVEVRLSVVQAKQIEQDPLTNLLTNSKNANEINVADMFTENVGSEPGAADGEPK